MCENNLLWPWNSNRSTPEYQERHMSINRSPSIGLKTLFNVHNMYRMSNVTAAIFQNWICCVHTTMQLYARAGLPVQAHPYDIRICFSQECLNSECQILILKSVDPLASRPPSSFAKDATPSLCPFSVPAHAPVSRSQNLIVWSTDPLKSRPSSSTNKQVTEAWCLSSVVTLVERFDIEQFSDFSAKWANFIGLVLFNIDAKFCK